MIPKSQNPVVVTSEPFVPDFIPRTIRVLAAVGLDDETTLVANEIDSVRSDRLLSYEFKSI